MTARPLRLDRLLAKEEVGRPDELVAAGRPAEEEAGLAVAVAEAEEVTGVAAVDGPP